MEFIKKLETLKTYEDFRVFKSVKAGNYRLSIQGSAGHYCTPREVVKPSMYSSMEVAILRKDKHSISLRKSSVIRQMIAEFGLHTYIDGCHDNASVFGYVPVEKIEAMYQYLKNYKS